MQLQSFAQAALLGYGSPQQATALRTKQERDYLLSVLHGIIAAPNDIPEWLNSRVRCAINNVTKS